MKLFTIVRILQIKEKKRKNIMEKNYADKVSFYNIMQAFKQTSYMIGSWNPAHTWENRSKKIKKILKQKKQFKD